MSRVTLLCLKTSIYLIFIDAALFKTAFEEGQTSNASLGKPDEAKKEEQEEKPKEDAAKDDEKAEKEEDKDKSG